MSIEDKALEMVLHWFNGKRIIAVGPVIYAHNENGEEGERMISLMNNIEAEKCRSFLSNKGIAMTRIDSGGSPEWEFNVTESSALKQEYLQNALGMVEHTLKGGFVYALGSGIFPSGMGRRLEKKDLPRYAELLRERGIKISEVNIRKIGLRYEFEGIHPFELTLEGLRELRGALDK